MALAMAQDLGISGISVGTATLLTNPFDVVKTRLQLQRLRAESVAGAEKPPGLVRTGVLLVKNEGALALWNGLPPALARGFIYGGLRLGLYSPIKDAMARLGSGSNAGSGSGSTAAADRAKPPPLSLGGKLLAGSISGGMAAAISNPTELIKTRLQTKGNEHKGSMAVIRHVVSTEGIAGLWRGAVPAMSRAALVTACQCGTYDEIKAQVVKHSGWGECLTTHLASSTLAGLIATTATNPLDVIKTVVFVSGDKYSGTLAAAADILKNDGPMGFYKGWVANFARLGPQTIITFIVYERLRDVVGMKAL